MLTILIFIGLLQIIILLGHYPVYKSIIFFMDIKNKKTINILRLTFFLLATSFVLSTILATQFNNTFTNILYTISSGWLGLAYFLVLASTALWIIKLLSIITHLKLNFKILTRILLTIAILVGTYGIINASIIQITLVTVNVPNLPESWKDKTAVWISDTHLGQLHSENFAKKVTKMIETINPNILFIGGDFFDNGSGNLKNLVSPFSELKIKDGTYFVTGNHEGFLNKEAQIKEIKKAGITVLENEIITIDGVQIIGVNYADTKEKTAYQKILANLKINKNIPSILLKHEPKNLDIAETAGISLEISGHTHQAQFYPLEMITALMYKDYDYGLKSFGNMEVLVSSGTGTWGPPSRVGTKSEILLINFK